MKRSIAVIALVLLSQTTFAATPPIDRVALQAKVRADFLYSWQFHAA